MRQAHGRAVVAAVVVVLGSHAASAEGPTPALELSTSVGRLVTFRESQPLPTFEIAVGVPVHDRFALEGVLAAIPDNRSNRAIDGFYTIRVKHDLDQPGARLQSFFTYGVAGYYPRNAATSPLDPAVLLALGTGLEKSLGRHAMLRLDLGVFSRLWLGTSARASGGVSFGFGRR